MNTLPHELLDLILGQLIEEPTPQEYQNTDGWRDNVHHLCQARLVCHQWNLLATSHLFYKIVLAYTDKDTAVWDKILNSEVVHHARNLHIRTHCLDDYPHGDSEWMDEDLHDIVLNSAKRIEELSNLEALHLRFSRHCRGVETSDPSEEAETETISMRQQMLENVFTAMHNRRHAGRNSRPIRSLMIENLQNVPLPHFTSSHHFTDVMKEVTYLHLMVQEEYREAGPDHDMYRIERRIFESYLRRAWLTPFSDHLVSLTLYFKEPWGAIMGCFDAEELSLPALKTLTLGNYVIAHHHQFDWVLEQKSLTALYLDRCAIVSYITYTREDGGKWQMPAHDWVEQPFGSLHDYADDMVYTFSGTWELVFDAIRTSLPNLRDFRFHNEDDNEISRALILPIRLEMLSNVLHHRRYCTFGSRWYFPDLDFDPKPGVLEMGSVKVNPAEENEAGDRRAFEALLEEIRAR